MPLRVPIDYQQRKGRAAKLQSQTRRGILGKDKAAEAEASRYIDHVAKEAVLRIFDNESAKQARTEELV